MRQIRHWLEDRIAEIQGELALRNSCGPDSLEQEEELLDELAMLERDSHGELVTADKKSIQELDKWI